MSKRKTYHVAPNNVTNLPKIAEPTIEQVLKEFLADQQKRLKPKAVSGYKDVI